MPEELQIPPLRSFVAIADAGGFSRAATARGISQSTVSQHVRLLERMIGVPLVRKEGRGTKFTPAGERLLGEARRLLAVHDEVQSRLLRTAAQPPITIGSTETAADELLPEILATVKAAFPERKVQFHIERSTRLTEMLRRGEIDIALLLGFDGDTPGAVVGRLPLRWYRSAAKEILRNPFSQQELPLVAYTEPCGMRQRALRALHASGSAVEIVAESGDLEGVIAGARAGLGLAVLPSAGADPAGLSEHPGLPPLGEIGVHLAVRRGGVEDGVVSTVLDALRSFFPSAPDIDPSDVVAVPAEHQSAAGVPAEDRPEEDAPRQISPGIRELAARENWSVVTLPADPR